MSRFLAEKYRSLNAYTPGEQPRDMQYIKLNTNESPYPPPSGVADALTRAQIEGINLYPDPESGRLKDKIAEVYCKSFGEISRKNVFVANGSDDILNFAFMALCGRGTVCFPDITYGFYRVFAELHGLSYREIPLTEDFSVNTADYMTNSGAVVLANPNAPTGKVLPLCEIEAILSANSDYPVIIDEAYVDFGGESAISLCNKYDNLLVVFTFSKSRQMAGARLGFALGNNEIIADLEKIKYSTNPYNVNRMTEICGIATLEDASYFEKNCCLIAATRDRTAKELLALGFALTDSKANFIFAKHEKIGGRELYIRLREKGILVRNFTNERIKDYNRITVGSPGQMKALVSAVGLILKEY